MHKTLSGGPGYASPRLEKAMLAADEEVKQEIKVEINADFHSKNLKKYNSDFEKIIKNQNNLFEYCYLKSKLNGIEGEIKFEVTLDTKSQIVKVKVIENTLNDKEIEKCLVNKIRALKTVTPDTNRNVKFVLSLSFES